VNPVYALEVPAVVKVCTQFQVKWKSIMEHSIYDSVRLCKRAFTKYCEKVQEARIDSVNLDEGFVTFTIMVPGNYSVQYFVYNIPDVATESQFEVIGNGYSLTTKSLAPIDSNFVIEWSAPILHSTSDRIEVYSLSPETNLESAYNVLNPNLGKGSVKFSTSKLGMYMTQYLPDQWGTVVAKAYFNVTYFDYSIAIADTVTNGTQKIEWEAPDLHSTEDKITIYYYDNMILTYTLVDSVRVGSQGVTYGVVKLTTKRPGKHICTYERNNAVATLKEFIVTS